MLWIKYKKNKKGKNLKKRTEFNSNLLDSNLTFVAEDCGKPEKTNQFIWLMIAKVTVKILSDRGEHLLYEYIFLLNILFLFAWYLKSVSQS